MTTQQPDNSPSRRIIVLLDSSRSSGDTLEAALQLAARRRSEVLGLFVEDTDLLRSAELPFGGEIGVTSGQIRPMELKEIERRLHYQAEEVRRRLATAARRHAVQWTFQVSRGRPDTTTMAVTHPTDLLVVGRVTVSGNHHAHVTEHTFRIASGANCSVMIVGRTSVPEARKPVLVLYDASDSGARAVRAAAVIARDAGQALTVLLPPNTSEATDQLETAARQGAELLGSRPAFMRLPDEDAESLAMALRSTGGQALILSRQSRALQSAAGRRLLDEIESPVVVVP
ncbi:MAG: universal stress protein [Ectothiorhodospiraceae bacterium]|jgi:nucleotide-binding universal stress UspA family protein